MKTVAVAVIKGGTGKTATAAALAQAAVRDGKKVLAVDLDPQANLTFTLAADANRAGAYELFEGEAARKLVQHTPQGVDCIAASPNLCAVTTYTGSARRLKNALQALAGDYDVCITDTPPTIGELVYNALQAADGLLIPLEADTYSLQGLYQIADIARRIRESNPSLQILGTVVSRYNGRTNVNRFMRDAIEHKAGKKSACRI